MEMALLIHNVVVEIHSHSTWRIIFNPLYSFCARQASRQQNLDDDISRKPNGNGLGGDWTLFAVCWETTEPETNFNFLDSLRRICGNIRRLQAANSKHFPH
jgi:hypothetical protein